MAWNLKQAIARWALKSAGSSYSLSDPGLASILATNGTASGKNVDEGGMLKVAAAWCCIRIITETVGALPWAIFERNDDGSVAQTRDHPLAILLRMPNADMTDVEFKEALVFNLCIAGNGYNAIERTGDRIVALTPHQAASVKPKRRNQGTGEIYFEVKDVSGRTVEVPREKMWQVKGFGRGLLEGLSPLGAAREAVGLAMATEEFGSRFFKQGGMPSGFVTIPNTLTTDQRTQARAKLQEMVTGMGNAFSFALFEGNMKPEPWNSMPLEDMQFLSLREFSVEEICRFYRVPPHMVADLRRATFANIEHLSQEFVMFTLMPYFTRIESGFSRWLLKPGEADRFFLKFKYEGLLRADSKGRSEFYQSGLQNGWITRNEVRAKEDLNRADGLDEFTAQLNLAPVDMLGDIAQANIDKANAPAPAPFAPADPASKGAVMVVNNVPEAKGPTIRVETHDVSVAAMMPELRSVVAEVRSVADQLSDQSTRVENSLGGLAKIASMPRKVIYGPDGEVIGTEPVETLTT